MMFFDMICDFRAAAGVLGVCRVGFHRVSELAPCQILTVNNPKKYAIAKQQREWCRDNSPRMQQPWHFFGFLLVQHVHVAMAILFRRWRQQSPQVHPLQLQCLMLLQVLLHGVIQTQIPVIQNRREAVHVFIASTHAQF